MRSLISLAFAALVFQAQALTSGQVASEFHSKLEPFFAGGQAVTFYGARGVRLEGHYFIHPAPSRGTILVVNGFGETFRKYVEVAYDLYAQGYSVFLYDHRGQGASQHLLADPQRAYIDQFQYLVSDLKTYLDRTVKVHGVGPYYLLAHSMGGAVAALFLEQNPLAFKAAILSAPMLGINFHGKDYAPLKWLLDLVSFLGSDKFYVQGAADPLLTTFAQQTVTHDQNRYEILNQEIRARHPQNLLWGQTARWVDQSFHAGDTAVTKAAATVTPTLLLQAGQDELVTPAPQEKFCRAAARCQLVPYPNSRHEILMETDDIRADALSRILEHFDGAKPLAVDKNEILF